MNEYTEVTRKTIQLIEKSISKLNSGELEPERAAILVSMVQQMIDLNNTNIDYSSAVNEGRMKHDPDGIIELVDVQQVAESNNLLKQKLKEFKDTLSPKKEKGN